MPVDITAWTQSVLAELKKLFDTRLVFVGLQGSCSRGEATENSDIDMVVILDRVQPEDMIAYGNMLDRLPHREKACGFFGGVKELLNWERYDLLTLYWDTQPLLGSLDFLKDLIAAKDVRRAVRVGACQIYHLCGHNLIHEKSTAMLKSLYKSAVYTLQAISFLQTGIFRRKKSDLLPVLEKPEQEILKIAMALSNSEEVSREELEKLSGKLLCWASRWIEECGTDPL